MASPSSPEVIDVDVDEPPRITGGTGKPDAPLEIASSDSEDESPAKRAKPAPATVTPPSQIFDRLRPFLPARKRDGNGAEWRLLGLNECLRFLKYKPGMFFKQHPDGAHPSRHAVPRRSFITLLLYLNEGYTGGHTTIWNAVGGQYGPWTRRNGKRADPGVPVPPRIGMALVHDHILLHESPELRVGVKHVIRTDVMYERVR